MTTLEYKYPTMEHEIDGVRFQSFGFMRIWETAWYWMDKWGIPIEDWHRQRIKGLDMSSEKEPTKESMAYYIIERCENLSKDKIPKEFLPIIHEYKIRMMNTWGWPEWGYSDVRHLKPKKGTEG